MRALAPLILIALACSGCGYRGPLYLPDSKPAARKPAAPAPAAPPQRPTPSEAPPSPQ